MLGEVLRKLCRQRWVQTHPLTEYFALTGSNTSEPVARAPEAQFLRASGWDHRSGRLFRVSNGGQAGGPRLSEVPDDVLSGILTARIVPSAASLLAAQALRDSAVAVPDYLEEVVKALAGLADNLFEPPLEEGRREAVIEYK